MLSNLTSLSTHSIQHKHKSKTQQTDEDQTSTIMSSKLQTHVSFDHQLQHSPCSYGNAFFFKKKTKFPPPSQQKILARCFRAANPENYDLFLKHNIHILGRQVTLKFNFYYLFKLSTHYPIPCSSTCIYMAIAAATFSSN